MEGRREGGKERGKERAGSIFALGNGRVSVQGHVLMHTPKERGGREGGRRATYLLLVHRNPDLDPPIPAAAMGVVVLPLDGRPVDGSHGGLGQDGLGGGDGVVPHVVHSLVSHLRGRREGGKRGSVSTFLFNCPSSFFLFFSSSFPPSSLSLPPSLSPSPLTLMGA